MAGPQPPGLQYERVACLEQSRTEEMMRPGEKCTENSPKKKKKSPEERNWINDEVVWMQFVCVSVYAFVQVCMCVTVCAYFRHQLWAVRGGRVCRNKGSPAMCLC